MIKFKDVKVGQLFSDASTCEIMVKVSDTLSQVYDAQKGEVYKSSWSNQPMNFEFPMTHEVEEYCGEE